RPPRPRPPRDRCRRGPAAGRRRGLAPGGPGLGERSARGLAAAWRRGARRPPAARPGVREPARQRDRARQRAGASVRPRRRRRRGVLLLGLALTLGGLAAADVARREAALDRRLGPAVPVVAARTALAPGDRVTPDRLVVRRVPARYAPAGAYGALGEAVGLRVATALPAGAYVTPGAVGGGSGGAAAGP